MTIRLSRGEYWILELVSEIKYSLQLLFSPTIDEAVNKAGHGLSQSALVDTLLSLGQQQLIAFKRRPNHELIDNISAQFIEQYLASVNKDPSSWVYYELTAQGGLVWESFAQPDWKRYLGMSFQPLSSGSETLQLRGQNRHLMDQYLASLHFHQMDLDFSSLTEQRRAPWQATYWKSLPWCHQLTLTCQRNWPQLKRQQPPAPDWYEQLWYRWR